MGQGLALRRARSPPHHFTRNTFITQMINHLHRNAPGFRFIERPRNVAVQRGPGIFVDFVLQRGSERFIRIVCAQEISVADEEALLVVVGVDEPAGDAVGSVALDLARARVEDVNALDSNAQHVIGIRFQFDVGFAEDNEEIALAGIL